MLAKGALKSEAESPILKDRQYSWKVSGAMKQPAAEANALLYYIHIQTDRVSHAVQSGCHRCQLSFEAPFRVFHNCFVLTHERSCYLSYKQGSRTAHGDVPRLEVLHDCTKLRFHCCHTCPQRHSMYKARVSAVLIMR